ncbi:hypothetical protein ACO0SA_003271 [Hanseniaspora valbyensis]
MTRLEKESPTMNNVLANNINNSINLIDGLKLRVPDRSYQHRCGNFLDIYELITEFDKIDDYKVGKIVKFFQSKSGRIGLVYDVTNKNGILTILGMLRAVLENNINSSDEQKLELVILDNVPRFKDDSISYLVLDDLKDIRFLNGSEKWYKEVLVVNDISTTGTTNILSINDVTDSIPFNEKIITLNNYLMLDNNKLFEYNDTTFTQNNLVSAISSFLSILPSGHFLTKNDVLTVLVDFENKSFNNVQLFFKALMMLMTGGKVNFIRLSENEETNIPKETTLLQATSANINRLLSIGGYQDVKTKFGYRLSKTLQLENVFQKTFKTELNNLRIIMITRMTTQQVSTSHLSLLKTIFQSRLILETYIPMEAGSIKTLGPIFTTNLFDHRTFNPKVEANVTFAGVVYPSLQFKLLKRESDEDKIGELKIRGFTIGLPIKKLKEKYSDEIGKDADGWVSVFGVSGCIGADTCFWELNKQN